MKKEGCCVQCLKQGNRSHYHKSNKNCVMYGKKYLELMCPELMRSQNVCKSLPGKNEQSVDNMSNKNSLQEAVLQTWMVKLREDNGNVQKVRALIQSGCQQSNMLKETVTDLRVPISGI